MSVRRTNLLKSIPAYAGHAHFWERLTRRQFLATAGGTTVGLLVGSDLGFPELANAETLPLPNPIPGGFHASDFGITIPNSNELFHAFAPLAAPGNDPISITDFHGFIAAAEITGFGTVTPPVMTPKGRTNRLFFDDDMRFMQGHYIGVDGQEHNGTFGFF